MLHPQAKALIDLMAKRGVAPTHTLSPAEARAVYRDRRFYTQPEPPVVGQAKALSMDGPNGAVTLRMYKPIRTEFALNALPVLVYFHGGGWVIGDLDTHDVLCRQLANGSGCAVVAVDYRLGPEHPFPAAPIDCYAATQWVSQNAATLGLDATRLGVGGDSAGGNLAAVVALMARDAGDLPICHQLLIYPATDLHYTSDSHTRNAQGYMLTSDTAAYFNAHYLGGNSKDRPEPYADWRASPLLAASHANLPPALVITAGYDVLRDEGVAYAQKLTESGVQANLISFERQIHGFITMGRVLDEANMAVRLCASELRAAMTVASGVAFGA